MPPHNRPIGARFHFQFDSGFSLLELLLTIGIIGVVSAIAMLQFGTAQQSIRGDGAMRVALAQLNTARELSISERRNIQLRVLPPNGLQIVRQEVPAGTTVIGTVVFEGGVTFHVSAGLPDTPDSFGKAAAVDFGDATAVLFSSDGTCIDETGSPVNGTFFLAQPGQPLSSRAITILGATGRVRAYRWNGASWVRV